MHGIECRKLAICLMYIFCYIKTPFHSKKKNQAIFPPPPLPGDGHHGHAVAGLQPRETGFTARCGGGGRGGHPLGAVGEGILLGFFY